MTWYEYQIQVLSAAVRFLEDCLDDGRMVGCLYTETEEINSFEIERNLWEEDSVTGNGSGSYTMSATKAIENVRDAIWTPGFRRMADEWDVDLNEALDDPEGLDVKIRCYLLGKLHGAIAEKFAARNGWAVSRDYC